MDNRQYADSFQAMERAVGEAGHDCIADPVDVEAWEATQAVQRKRSSRLIRKAISKMEEQLGYTVTPHNEA